MTQENPEQAREVAVQREVARVALAGVDGFALAGSGAIREHGMIERPTEDVDLFTTSQDVTAFSVAVDQVTDQLRGSGYQVEQTRRAPQYARLHVATDDVQLDVDLGVDWRQDDPTAPRPTGPAGSAPPPRGPGSGDRVVTTVGYARVSTRDQNTASQERALTEAAAWARPAGPVGQTVRVIDSSEARPSGRLRRLGAWYDRHRGARSIVVGWLVTRALSLLLLMVAERYISGDVFYYWRKLRQFSEVGLDQTLNEYPTPVVWILQLPYAATGGLRTGYLIGFVVFMLLLDAAFTYALYRAGGRRHDRAVDFWLLFVPLVGGLSYLRFDLLPAVLAGGAILAARRRPWVTGALIGLGAAVKLWPALLIPAFLAHKSDRRAAGLAFVVVGFGLAGVSLLAGGMARLFSPLTWQSDRGLQIESIWSVPLMVARTLRPDNWTVQISRYQAYEIFGPGVEIWVGVSNIATVLGLVGLAVLFVRAFRAGGGTPVAVGFLVLTTVAVMIVTNKTLSPQYLLWLGGPGAALLLLRHRAAPVERAAVRHTAYALLALALLTHLVYPTFYNGLLGDQGHAMIGVATLVTTVRNLGLLVFTGYVAGRAWRFTRAGQPTIADASSQVDLPRTR